jgi:uncharacterized phage-associated protein
MIDRQREKLLQVVVYFATNVRKLGKVKLFKLLYFLDFEHFRATGRSVTGLDYFAWQMGPVPVSLYSELDGPLPDWQGKAKFTTIPTAKGKMLSVKAEADFDPSHFTRRELGLLDQLAAEFKFTDADDMIEATHLENLPWHKIWVEQGAKQALIPYDLALRQQDREAMLAAADDHSQMVRALSK